MGGKEIIDTFRAFKNEHGKRYGIIDIGIFGSFSRDEAADDIDVDIVVHIVEPDLFMLVGIKNEMEERLNRQVDIVAYGENMNPFLKKRIDKEAVYA